MNLLKRVLAVFLILLFGVAAVAMADSRDRYLDQGVEIAYVEDARPLCFIGTTGEPEGMTIDFWRVWSDKTGIPIRFTLTVWEETIDKVTKGSADVHGGLVRTAERERMLDFSQPMFEFDASLIIRAGLKGGLQAIVLGGTVGAVKDAHSVQLVLEQLPQAQLKEYSTPEALVEAFARGELDGAVVYLPTFHLKNSQRAKPIEYEAVSQLGTMTLRAAVSKGNEELLDLINEGFSRINEEERRYIQDRWFVTGGQKEERNFFWLWVAAAVFLIGIALVASTIALRPRKW